jgi:MFS family permease
MSSDVPTSTAEVAVQPGGIFSRGHVALTAGLMALSAVLTGQALAAGTVLPVAARDLHGTSAYAWTFISLYASAQLGVAYVGRVSDRVRLVWPFSAGIGSFVAGQTIIALAPTMTVLVVGRAIEGFGLGASYVVEFVVIARYFSDRLRPKVFAALSSAVLPLAVTSPVLAGLIAEESGWRWVFAGCAVLTLPSVLLIGQVLIRENPVPDARDVPAEVRWGNIEMLALALGVAMLQLGGGASNLVSVAAMVAGMALVLFGLRRVLPAGTLRGVPGLPAMIATRGLGGGVFLGTQAFLPLILTSTQGFSPAAAGLALTMGSVGWTAGALVQGSARIRVGRDRLVAGGAALLSAGVALVCVITVLPVPRWVPLFAWGIGGVGVGLVVETLNGLVLSTSSEKARGVSSSLLLLCDMLGATLAVSLGGAIMLRLRAAGLGNNGQFLFLGCVMLALILLALPLAGRLLSTPQPRVGLTTGDLNGSTSRSRGHRRGQ